MRTRLIFCNVAMATAVWAEGNVIESASMASPLQPRHSAPPTMQQHVSQDAAQDEVVWDDSMMDLDDYEETQLHERTDPVSTSGLPEDMKPTEIGDPYIQLSANRYRPFSGPHRSNSSTRSRQSLHKRRTVIYLDAIPLV